MDPVDPQHCLKLSLFQQERRCDRTRDHCRDERQHPSAGEQRGPGNQDPGQQVHGAYVYNHRLFGTWQLFPEIRGFCCQSSATETILEESQTDQATQIQCFGSSTF